MPKMARFIKEILILTLIMDKVKLNWLMAIFTLVVLLMVNAQDKD